MIEKKIKTQYGDYKKYYKCACGKLKKKYQWMGEQCGHFEDIKLSIDICPKCGTFSDEWIEVSAREIETKERHGFLGIKYWKTIKTETQLKR